MEAGGNVPADDGFVRRSVRAPKPIHTYTDILDAEDIQKQIMTIEKKTAAVEAAQAHGEHIDEIPLKQAIKSSKKRSRDGGGSKNVALAMPDEIADMLDSYKPCIICLKKYGIDCLSFCPLCLKYFHKLCLKDSTVDLACAACDNTRVACAASKVLKQARFAALPPAIHEDIYKYRMTVFHRFAYPHAYPAISKKRPSPAAAAASEASSPPAKKPKRGGNMKKKAAAKKSASKQVAAATLADEIEIDSTPIAPDAASRNVKPSAAKRALNMPADDHPLGDASTHEEPIGAEPTDVHEGVVPEEAAQRPAATVHVVEIDDDDVKVEHTDPTVVDPVNDVQSELVEEEDVAVLEMDVGLSPPVSKPTSAAADAIEQVEAPAIVATFMDEEDTPAAPAAAVASDYEAAWPTGMFGGNEVVDVLDGVVATVVNQEDKST
ncbi:Aste57867_10317 [Aphanomyces stellatus]|uniref:Aste57867_10317 protein n=1 Tax=Aphanomyces stellatus TaxID=120398 RepID=A0A485KR17_9STRA|nr:hypothetical protein As57867_010277 [Aphanomyces stellatus]VFT87191.1 Aste57867_10317 [Aphanomyces stellatus]